MQIRLKQITWQAAWTGQVERIAAPTFASWWRARRGSAPACLAPAGGAGGAAAAPHVCQRHARRQAAAAAYTGTACSCDARHRPKSRQRRASADVPQLQPDSAPCRRPFPLAVHDLRLAPLHRKLTAS
ncbi:unnamed protein product [Parnassius apollo]|uniref:(apollo) hypothetical protein n=1 Tax=Parnassius apollo TaxID=110799 RepID=A0A8S3X9X1_PARAO|nr:unnamed protein product [Parnassius apollo]